MNFLLFSSLAFLFLELYLSLQVLEYHILVLVRLFLKIHVISERLWKVQSGRLHESHHVDLTFTFNVTVLLGLKAANGFWISLLFLPGSCYNVSSFEILGFTRALACVRTDVPPPLSLALLLIFSVGGGTFVHGSLVSTRYSFPDTRWTEEINWSKIDISGSR